MRMQNAYARVRLRENIERVALEVGDQLARQVDLSRWLNLEAMVRSVLKDTPIDPANIDVSEVVTALRWAWRYEEQYIRHYTLQQALAWFRDNRPNDVRTAALLRERPAEDERQPGSAIKLMHCFLAADDHPMLDGSAPVRLVVAQDIAADLQGAFGQKDLVLFK